MKDIILGMFKAYEQIKDDSKDECIELYGKILNEKENEIARLNAELERFKRSTDRGQTNVCEF